VRFINGSRELAVDDDPKADEVLDQVRIVIVLPYYQDRYCYV